jgi:hypothetical protein
MTDRHTIQSLTGVYHADGGERGELAYVFGRSAAPRTARSATSPTEAYAATPQWSNLVCELDVPFDLVHLNERTPEVAAASEDRTPCVLAHTETGVVRLLGPDDLDPVEGDVTKFADALRTAADAAQLAWPATPSPAPAENTRP